MSGYILILISFLSSLTVAALLNPWILKVCHKRRIYDHTDCRKIHQNDIPRLGGIIFVPCTIAGIATGLIAVLGTDKMIETIHTSTLLMGCGLLTIYIMGILDDLFQINAGVKLIIQIATSSVFPICSLYVNNLYGFLGIWEIPFSIGAPLTMFLVVLTVNTINLIDGIDGLASSFSLIAITAISIIFYREGIYLLCMFIASLAAALISFMYFNIFGSVAKNNKIFMGDSGSLLLGFCICYLCIKCSMQTNYLSYSPFHLLLPVTLLVIPTFDLMRVAICRILRGEHPFHPDKTHIHHLVMNTGRSQRDALFIIIGTHLLLMTINLTLYYLKTRLDIIFLIDIIAYLSWILYIQKNKKN